MNNTKMNNQSFEEWSKSLESMDFDHYSLAIKEKIMESDLDDYSKQAFEACFEYVTKLYKAGKPLDVNLLKIHLEEVKGFKNIKMDEFINLMLLLSYCGFSINFMK